RRSKAAIVLSALSPQRVQQERQSIARERDQLRRRGAGTEAHIAVDAKEDGCASALRRLERGAELVAVRRGRDLVALSDGDERRRIGTLLDALERREGEQRFELRRPVRRAVLRNPRLANREACESRQVEHTGVEQYRAECVGASLHRRGDERRAMS